MAFQITKKALWRKVEELHPSPSPQDHQNCKVQLEEAFYLLLDIQKENVTPEVIVKIDAFIAITAKKFKA